VRRRFVIAAATAAALAATAAPATAQTVQAVDAGLTWAPQVVTIPLGGTVTWRFAGTTGLHNVESTGTGWSWPGIEPAVAPPDVSYTFATSGEFMFVCRVHQDTMRGKVVVNDASGAPPPPPPPPPLSEQPWANDQPAPTVLERLDRERPRLTRLRAAPTARGARVRFRLSESGRVRIAVLRGGRTVRTTRANVRRGSSAVSVPRLRAGRYRVEVRARDLSGNRARARRTRLTIRR
jgi:plastocyanin